MLSMLHQFFCRTVLCHLTDKLTNRESLTELYLEIVLRGYYFSGRPLPKKYVKYNVVPNLAQISNKVQEAIKSGHISNVYNAKTGILTPIFNSIFCSFLHGF